MNPILDFATAGVAGVVLGLVFFGGLWLTVKQLPVARHPGLLALGSLFGRLAVTLVVFYFLLDGAWQQFAAGMAGFLGMRVLFTRRLRPGGEALETR